MHAARIIPDKLTETREKCTKNENTSTCKRDSSKITALFPFLHCGRAALPSEVFCSRASPLAGRLNAPAPPGMPHHRDYAYRKVRKKGCVICAGEQQKCRRADALARWGRESAVITVRAPYLDSLTTTMQKDGCSIDFVMMIPFGSNFLFVPVRERLGRGMKKMSYFSIPVSRVVKKGAGVG